MRKAPNLWTLPALSKAAIENNALIDGEWVPARPMGLDELPYRLRWAWGVFTGKYDALLWPKGQ